MHDKRFNCDYMAGMKQAIDGQIKVRTFEDLLLISCTRRTSAAPDGWTKENPLYGHCAVVSLVAQNLYGGELLRTSLENTPFSSMGSHYINRIEGVNRDFTAPQFGDNYPSGLQFEPKTRDYVLFDPVTRQPRVTMDRYKVLAFNLAKALYKENPLFDDPTYQLCFGKALDSGCKKMWFGSVITHGSEVVYAGTNAAIEPLKSLCTPDCVRDNIQSRTESMIGGCGHAEELGLWEVAKKGIPLSECSLYVAGLHTNGLPWIKTEAEHTCLRCAVQMYNAGIGSILVPVHDKWMAITPEEAVSQAMQYATGQKKVVRQALRTSE